MRGYNYDTTSIRRPFDCLSKVIKVTLTWPASRSHADLVLAKKKNYEDGQALQNRTQVDVEYTFARQRRRSFSGHFIDFNPV